MEVELTRPLDHLIVRGVLKTGKVSEEWRPGPVISFEMCVTGVPDPVKVTLDQVDLETITRSARASNIQEIREAVSYKATGDR